MTTAAFTRALPDAAATHRLLSIVRDSCGWVAYIWLIVGLATLLPDSAFEHGGREFVLTLGLIGLWRYSLGVTHYIRALIFRHRVYPRHRALADALGEAAQPSHVYFLVTSFRIDARTTAAVYRSVIEEALRCHGRATVIASIVEYADEGLIMTLWRRYNPPAHVRLRIVRIAGTGKRDGLAQGFRAISRDAPDDRAVVAVVDGDTVLQPGVIERCAPFLQLFPNVGALTTNEFCEVDGSWIMREWHRLRFAQRHINMCSMALSMRVLTLTGRMSIFRAGVVIDPGFIQDVESDQLDHWRLGRFRFLTGDDKSSWYSLMRLGYDTYYVPDAAISTMEHPPDKSFLRASRRLMFRWYGNSLRQNSRATRLGRRRLGLFCWYVLYDQRISMWTSMLGLTAAMAASLQLGIVPLLAYAIWVCVSRLLMTFLLIASGHRVGPAYPLLLYYNQIVGALMKIHVFFNLDQQSWTRQKTVLSRDLDTFQRWFNPWSSRAMTFSATSIFVALVYQLV